MWCTVRGFRVHCNPLDCKGHDVTRPDFLAGLPPDDEFIDMCLSYAAFLEADKSLPQQLGIPIGGFMLLAPHLPSVLKPSVWIPKQYDETLGPAQSRVYFDVWSQNKLHAIRFMEKAYFCPETLQAYIETFGKRVPLKSGRPRSFYSGAKTQDAIWQTHDGLQWLKDLLESTF